MCLKGGQHILYIDDDESLLLLVKRVLERRGYRISGYVNQDEALDVLRADPSRFDLVVSDYNMPGASGLDVARAVRAIRADLPLAVASGFIDEALRAQADGAGVRKLIFKADAVQDLCEAIAQLAQTLGARPNPL
jgi:CheY-like chemotaxis protein